MNEISIQKIADAARGYIVSGDPAHVITSVSTDSRAAGRGSLFVALTGGSRDAHDFIGSAYENGCRAFLISEERAASMAPDADVVLVPDTLQAMQDLAHYYLTTLDIRKVAVTGSVGKTSTRDMIWYILSEKYKTMRPEKNYNNEIGVPLTIFGLDSTYEAAVFEEGLEFAGDIHRLSAITRPDTAVITNIGVSHIENLGTRENIFRAKLEVADFLPPGGCLIVNADSDFLSKDNIDRGLTVIECGTDPEDDYYVHDIHDDGVSGVSFIISTPEGETDVELPVPGAHNAVNAALAAAAAAQFGATIKNIKAGLSKLRLTGKRLLVKEGNGIKVIDDSYNAAPASMKSAVDTLMSTAGKRHVALLAGMNELGENSEEYHREVGEYIKERNVDLLICIDEKAKAIAESASGGRTQTVWFPDKDSFYEKMDELVKEGDTVLVKGSNAYKMSEAADRLIGGQR